MSELLQEFTSTGSKLFWHQEAMAKLRDGKGMPIVSHIMPTDVCNFKCAFCSVQHRAGDSLKMEQIRDYLSQLVPLGLKAVILSGGGNPILFRDGKQDFNSLVEYIHGLGLEIGLISNGVRLVEEAGRMTWNGVRVSTLDMLKWVRISLSGWDHDQDRCDTPDLDPSKTTLGGSYVFHDIYDVPEEPHHGRVSTRHDVETLGFTPTKTRFGKDRVEELTVKLSDWNSRYRPSYCRLLMNCLEPELIPERSKILQDMAAQIDPSVFFVQEKMPRQPKRCLKGYPHPVANCDGFVYPCDSVVLQRTAGHKFGSAWRMCKMSEVAEFYSRPIQPNVPNDICPQCVFSDQVDLLSAIADGVVIPNPSGPPPEHVFFP